jgi:plastocyanin
MRGSSTGLIIAAVIAAGSLLLFGSMVVAMSMADHMDGMGMMRRSGGAPQTPVVVTGETVSVSIEDFDYIPRDITVDHGATVTWTNEDSVPHTATDDDGSWDTDRLDKGEGGSLTFETAGEYRYYCVYHTYMKGTVTVR